MVLIRQEVDKAAKSYANIPIHIDVDDEERYFNSNVREYDSFISGVEFAETQLSELAVEFAVYCSLNYTSYYSRNTLRWVSKDNYIDSYTIQELFELFLKERNQKQ